MHPAPSSLLPESCLLTPSASESSASLTFATDSLVASLFPPRRDLLVGPPNEDALADGSSGKDSSGRRPGETPAVEGDANWRTELHSCR